MRKGMRMLQIRCKTRILIYWINRSQSFYFHGCVNVYWYYCRHNQTMHNGKHGLCRVSKLSFLLEFFYRVIKRRRSSIHWTLTMYRVQWNWHNHGQFSICRYSKLYSKNTNVRKRSFVHRNNNTETKFEYKKATSS